MTDFKWSSDLLDITVMEEYIFYVSKYSLLRYLDKKNNKQSRVCVETMKWATKWNQSFLNNCII